MRSLTAILAGAIFVACTDHADVLTTEPVGSTPTACSVRFDSYMGLTGTTRGGAYGPIDTEVLKGSDYGFGVFAYKTGTGDQTYSRFRTQNAEEKRYPNFMYNEPIKWDGEQWTYAIPENVKYWPNEDDSNVSFFAYGPYTPETEKVSASDITGQAVMSADEGGILAFSTPSFNGGQADADATNERYKYSDPYLLYKIAAYNSQQVDLLWGTMNTNNEQARSGNTLGSHSDDATLYPEKDQMGNNVEMRPAFLINTDMNRQNSGGTVNFLFKHALAKIGGSYTGNGDGSDEDPLTPTNGLMVVLDIEKDGAPTGGTLFPYAEGPTATTPYNTKVTINEIVLQSDRQLTDQGHGALASGQAFDYDNDAYTATLANQGIFNMVTGVWSDLETRFSSTGSYGFHAQRLLSPQAAASDPDADAILNANLAEPAIYTSEPYTRERYEELPIGVTTVAKNVFQSNGEQPFLFIPGTHPVITITVDYIVRSYDAKLADNYTEVRQRITRRLYILEQIELNKQYNILIHLGLTTMKFTATVDEWEVTNVVPTDTTDPDTGQTITTFDEEVQHVYL